jgi:hypothetical protein
MVKLKEKVTLKTKGSTYIVVALENRIEPQVGYGLIAADVEDLLLEAKQYGRLTVKIT